MIGVELASSNAARYWKIICTVRTFIATIVWQKKLPVFLFWDCPFPKFPLFNSPLKEWQGICSSRGTFEVLVYGVMDKPSRAEQGATPASAWTNVHNKVVHLYTCPPWYIWFWTDTYKDCRERVELQASCQVVTHTTSNESTLLFKPTNNFTLQI